MSHINKKMFEGGMDINRACLIIKEYQTKYIFIKEYNFELSQRFTGEIWWKTRH